MPTLTDTTTPRTRDLKAYLGRLHATLKDEERFAATKARISAETAAFTREHRDQLKPTWGRASLTLGKTLLGVLSPLILAWRFAEAGLWPVAALLVPIAGVALYGGISIVHDAVHGSFFPSRRANRLLGELLAPLFAMDFMTFKRSHMKHHRHNQSLTHDPKYPKVPWPAEVLGDEEAERRDGGLVAALLRLPIRGWFVLARGVLRFPAVVRHAFYVATVMVFGGPVALLFGGEISLLSRDWRAGGPLFSLVRTVLTYALLAWTSPLLCALTLGAVWISLGCFFLVYLTHLTPYQVYVEGKNHAVRFFSLNISDIELGPITRALGNSFTEHHAAHHLVPFAPSYRLPMVGAWLDASLGDLKAPKLRLGTVADTTFLGDGIVSSIVGPRERHWPHWETANGTFVTRVADGAADREPVPSMSVSQLIAAIR